MQSKPQPVKLTDQYIENITLPIKPRQMMHHDSLVPNFGLRVLWSGAKTWIVQRRVHGESRRIKIGRYPQMGLADAREEARRIQLLIEVGKDPRAEAERERGEQRHQIETQREKQRCREALAFHVVRDRFMAEYVESTKADGMTPLLRDRSRAEYRRMLHAKWLNDWKERPLTEISRGDALALLAAVHKKHGGYTANRLLAHVRKLMNWAVAQDLIQVSPATGIEQQAKEQARERVLHERELFHLWRAFDVAPVFSAPLKLLLLTAQRREEVAGMESVELENLDGVLPLWRIQKHRAKNGRAHPVPLVPLAVELIGALPAKPMLMFTTTSDTPISGFSKAKDNINAFLAEQREKAPDPAIDSLLADWRIHDFRRTAATCMAELGVSRDVVEAILNHKSGERAGVAGIYNRSELLDDRRLALELWARYLHRVTAERMDDRDIATLRAEFRAEYRRKLMGEIPHRPQLQIVELAA